MIRGAPRRSREAAEVVMVKAEGVVVAGRALDLLPGAAPGALVVPGALAVPEALVAPDLSLEAPLWGGNEGHMSRLHAREVHERELQVQAASSLQGLQ